MAQNFFIELQNRSAETSSSGDLESPRCAGRCVGYIDQSFGSLKVFSR